MNRTIRTRDGALELSDDGPSPSLLVRTPHERAAIDLDFAALLELHRAIEDLLWALHDVGPLPWEVVGTVPLLARESPNRAN